MTAALVERDRSRAGAARRGSRSRPKLKVLNQQAIRQRARRRHALLALFIVVLVGFFAVAFVHAELVADQQQLDGVRTRIAEAEAHRAKVERAAEEASSPSAIVNRAEELGMVRAIQPVYLAAAAPVRDVPTAISFRASQTVTAVGVASGPDGTTTISVGISGAAPVKLAAANELATPAAESAEPIVEAVSETTVVTPAAPAVGVTVETPVQSQPAVAAQPDQTPTVVGSSISVGGTAVSGQQADTGAQAGAGAAAPAPATPSLSGATAEQAPTSIAGTRAVAGGAESSASGEVSTSQFGGMSAGTGSG